MGNLSSSNTTSDQSQIISGQQLSKILINPSNSIYSSRVTGSDRNKKRQYIRKVIPFSDGSETITQYLTILEKYGKGVENNNMYLPIMCSIKGQQSVCNDYRKLELYYEHYDVKLTEEIEARRKARQIFSQAQIWYIMYSIFNAIRKFQKYQICSGDLKTQCVLLNNNGHVKVITKLSWPNEQLQRFDKNDSFLRFSTTSFSRKNVIKKFYSPEQLRIMRQNIEKTVNPNISQTYSVGIILLQLCSFINGDRCYDIGSKRINELAIQRCQQVIAHRYSKLLYNLIKTLLSNAYDRPLPSQVYSAFKPYEKKILSLSPFVFDTKNLTQSMRNSAFSYY